MLLGCDYGGLSGGPERDDHDAGRGLDFSEGRGDGGEVIAGSALLGGGAGVRRLLGGELLEELELG